MVIILSSVGIYEDNTLRSVVLPEPVPPETIILSLPLTAASRKRSILEETEPQVKRFSAEIGVLPNLRIVRIGPTRDTGGIITFTREPSRSLASHIGLDSSTCLPTRDTILSIICIRCWLSLN